LSIVEGMIGRIRHVFADDFPHATVKTDLQNVQRVENFLKTKNEKIKRTMARRISNLRAVTRSVGRPFIERGPRTQTGRSTRAEILSANIDLLY
jgi:hypothetical protein